MRFFAVAFLLAASCASPPPLHRAVTAQSAMTEELRVSFFESFDDASFRALAERAFRDRHPEADKLLNDVVWNWHPEMLDKAGRRRRARALLPPLAAHPDARVREGIWRLGRFLYDEPETASAWSSALPAALEDGDPDVRLASIETARDLHAGHTGGCVVGPKITSFSLRPHASLLARRLLEEPDVRIRRALLNAAGWVGRRIFLPALTRYFTDADRRMELASMSWTVWALFSNPEEGLKQDAGRPLDIPEATWPRVKEFAASLQSTAAARRNAVLLLLQLATEFRVEIREDAGILARTVEWLDREPDIVEEDELFLILHHWPVMDPAKVVHQLQGAVRQSNLPDVLKRLKEHLADLR
jgi:hypothetical protein